MYVWHCFWLHISATNLVASVMSDYHDILHRWVK